VTYVDLWVPKTRAAWQMSYGMQSFGQARCWPGQPWLSQSWDDLRLVGLKLIFLVVTRAVSVLGPADRHSRHDLGLASRHRAPPHLFPDAEGHFWTRRPEY
jgi:hypothetical protein